MIIQKLKLFKSNQEKLMEKNDLRNAKKVGLNDLIDWGVLHSRDSVFEPFKEK